MQTRLMNMVERLMKVNIWAYELILNNTETKIKDKTIVKLTIYVATFLYFVSFIVKPRPVSIVLVL